MKKLIAGLVLALSTVAAHSEALMYMSNQAGGKIVITDQPCNTAAYGSSKLLAYLTIPKRNKTDLGCWVYDKVTESVMVEWNSGRNDIRTYAFDDFTWTPFFTNQVKGLGNKQAPSVAPTANSGNAL